MLRDERTGTQLIFYGDLIFAIARRAAVLFALEHGEEHKDAAAEDFVGKRLCARQRKHATKHRVQQSNLTVDHRFAGANLHIAFRNMTFCATIKQRLFERAAAGQKQQDSGEGGNSTAQSALTPAQLHKEEEQEQQERGASSSNTR